MPTASPPQAPRNERRDAVRALRRAHEAQLRRAELRRHAWLQLLGTALAASAVVAAMIVLGNATRPRHEPVTTTAALDASSSRLDAIAQRGIALGSPDAPVTVVEFADLQCPFCARFARDELPAIIDRYVRTGSVRIELRLLAFIGEHSVKAARAAAQAAGRNRLWQFVDRFYRLQGAENSGYVTDAFLRRIDPATVGADPVAGDRAIVAAQAAAGALHVESTPTFAIGGRIVQADELDAAIAAELKR